jgi:hypothetical protein
MLVKFTYCKKVVDFSEEGSALQRMVTSAAGHEEPERKAFREPENSYTCVAPSGRLARHG